MASSCYVFIDGKSAAFVFFQDGTNALMAAASNGHLEAAQKLVAAGAALDKQNSDGHSALMFAYNGRAQVCFSSFLLHPMRRGSPYSHHTLFWSKVSIP